MEINDLYSNPFGSNPALRLSLVKRWGIIKMSREQSVAEHSFNVAIIVHRLLDHDILRKVACADTREEMMACVIKSLYHDADEVFTGDIPSCAKIPGQKKSNPIIKLADLIESHIFCKSNCCDTEQVKEWVMRNIWDSLISLCHDNDIQVSLIHHIMKDMSL